MYERHRSRPVGTQKGTMQRMENRIEEAARDAPIVRLVHLSDVHVAARGVWRLGDWLNKRLAAWINQRFLGRGKRFRHSTEILRRLRAELRERRPDRVVFSGDATALGLVEEEVLSAELLGVDQLPGLAVPGNHDYCTPADMYSGAFERYFAPGRRVTESVRIPTRSPSASATSGWWRCARPSPTTCRWTPAAPSAGSNSNAWQQLLARLEAGPRILVTHYPIALPGGEPEHRFRRLRDLEALLAVAVRGGIGLWLHGHRHDPYHHEAGRVAPFPVICAGSVTQTGLWSYGEYTIRGRRLDARLRSVRTG